MLVSITTWVMAKVMLAIAGIAFCALGVSFLRDIFDKHHKQHAIVSFLIALLFFAPAVLL